MFCSRLPACPFVCLLICFSLVALIYLFSKHAYRVCKLSTLFLWTLGAGSFQNRQAGWWLAAPAQGGEPSLFLHPSINSARKTGLSALPPSLNGGIECSNDHFNIEQNLVCVCVCQWRGIQPEPNEVMPYSFPMGQ